MIFFCYSFAFVIGCSGNLPSVMSKNWQCRRLKLNCTKLKNKCSSKLGKLWALKNSESSRKCRRALKGKQKRELMNFAEKLAGRAVSSLKIIIIIT